MPRKTEFLYGSRSVGFLPIYAGRPLLLVPIMVMKISDPQLISLFCEKNSGQVYVVRFANGIEEELMDCSILGDPKDQECIATIVRAGVGNLYSAGQAISFGFDDVLDVQVSKRGFEYYR